VGVMMHNLISYNQFAGWKQNLDHLNQTIEKANEQNDMINDYYNCLIECNDNQQVCKRICRSILSS
jgi:hypothetical protein